ncbi:MAG: hypothetical protein ACXAD7_19420 [Candidatus Kariarchaeaceae archaeon]|jgi:hypothetical protein
MYQPSNLRDNPAYYPVLFTLLLIMIIMAPVLFSFSLNPFLWYFLRFAVPIICVVLGIYFFTKYEKEDNLGHAYYDVIEERKEDIMVIVNKPVIVQEEIN